MMKILLVTTRFFPYGSATSGVVGNLAEALYQKDCEVHIIALTRFREDALHDKWKNLHVHKYYSPTLITKEQIKKEFRNHPVRCLRGAGEKITDRVIQSVRSAYKTYSINQSMVQKYKKAIETELKNHYDLCIVTLMPTEAVWAALSIDFQKTALAIYQLDPYWNNADLPKCYEKERFVKEAEIVRQSMFCMTTPIIYEENVKKLDELSKWYVKTEFPCLKMSENTNRKNRSDVKHCVFLGTLYPELRPPERLVSIISLLKTEKISFDFYGTGQYLVKQSKAFEKAAGRISLFGEVASDEAERVRSDADVLVNIDNTSTALVPSKIFEYVSTGKPIINCYFSEQSQVLRYLERYPLCVNINLYEDPALCAGKLDGFLRQINGETISFERIRELYYRNLPEYVADQCLEAYRDRVPKVGVL